MCVPDGKPRTDPLVPCHVPQSHRNVVGPVSEGTVGIWFRGVHIPIGRRACVWSSEFDGFPHWRGVRSESKMHDMILTARFPYRSFERPCCRLFKVWCCGPAALDRLLDKFGGLDEKP